MNLLALVETPDHVCCRYRIRAFAPALEEAGWSLTCEGLDKGTFSRTFQLRRAERFDAVVLQRKLLPAWQLRVLAGPRVTLSSISTTPSCTAIRTIRAVRRAAVASGVSPRRCNWPTRSSPAMISSPIVPSERGRGSNAST